MVRATQLSNFRRGHAVQEVLLIVARKFSSVRADVAFSGWMFSIVRHECRRLGRKALNFAPYKEEEVDRWIGSRDNDACGANWLTRLSLCPPTIVMS
jgi:DNA-directed RNA polymerase specialized sigma24 family protein